MTHDTVDAGGTGCPAVVAIKARRHCKSRLAEMLPPNDRVTLVRSMLDTVLRALAAARSIGRVLLVSPERDCVPAAIELLADDGAGLNPALDAARRSLLGAGAGELLILPADLPLITAADIDLLVARGRRAGFALAADAAGAGTNGLYLHARADFRFQFGVGSFAAHLAEAARLGLGGDVLQIPGLSFDVDGPADLARLRSEQGARRAPAGARECAQRLG